ncbi:MAG: SGNH/GDSL hydrolase family protein, partial [Victivallales bacterium]|nr:SGNH/GDSL hydrolase family protein [Victivallales bacterium]
SMDDVEKSWPTLLENSLQKRFQTKGKLSVLNVGIKGCGTAQGVARIARDITPFNPHLAVFSFTWGDAKLPVNKTLDEEAMAARLTAVNTAFEEFVAAFKETGTKLLCWLPNPVYPQNSGEKAFDSEAFKAWADCQVKLYESLTNQVRQNCKRFDIPLVDGHALFEVGGTHTAQKWMSNWFMHNEQGAANIANWIEDAIVKNKLIDADAFEDEAVAEPEAPVAVEEAAPQAEAAPAAVEEAAPQAEVVETEAPKAEEPAEAVEAAPSEEKQEN